VNVQNTGAIAFLLSCVDTACWVVCFWWMHRLSSRQNTLLEELHEMTRRVEKLSEREHDLISEVHPKVNEIKKHVENVREAVETETQRAR
jgi:hypothetical protein